MEWLFGSMAPSLLAFFRTCWTRVADYDSEIGF